MGRADSFCAMARRNLPVRVGGRTDYVRYYLGWAASEAALKGIKTAEKVAKAEAFYSQSGAVFEAKDRYSA
jgi:hypothetical protein